jgi:hypothetical protein
MNAGAVTGKTVGKTAVEQLVQKAVMSKSQTARPSASPPVQTAKTPPASSAKPLLSLINAAGLPADKLSASIISFARFFSLPLKPELMASLRRQSLSPETPAPGRETLSLAAAAAESKGVELRPKGLEWFASAIDPDWRRQDGEDRDRRERRHKKHEQENVPLKTRPLSAVGLKGMALESAEKYSTAILNKLPGKNGQHWMVFPFDFDESGREFRVSLRILLSADKQPPNNVACMALDIAESERRWLFSMNPAKGKVGRLSVYLQPELPPKALESFIGELARAMEMPREHICIKKWTETFPCESGGGEQFLRSINEAV